MENLMKKSQDPKCSTYLCMWQISNVWPRNVDVKWRLEQSPKTIFMQLSSGDWTVLFNMSESCKESKVEALLGYCQTGITVPEQVEESTYCEWFQNVHGECNEMLDRTWFTDEVQFHLSSLSMPRIPTYGQQKTLFPYKLSSVWCEISRYYIIGPIFFTALWTLPNTSKS